MAEYIDTTTTTTTTDKDTTTPPTTTTDKDTTPPPTTTTDKDTTTTTATTTSPPPTTTATTTPPPTTTTDKDTTTTTATTTPPPTTTTDTTTPPTTTTTDKDTTTTTTATTTPPPTTTADKDTTTTTATTTPPPTTTTDKDTTTTTTAIDSADKDTTPTTTKDTTAPNNAEQIGIDLAYYTEELNKLTAVTDVAAQNISTIEQTSYSIINTVTKGLSISKNLNAELHTHSTVLLHSLATYITPIHTSSPKLLHIYAKTILLNNNNDNNSNNNNNNNKFSKALPLLQRAVKLMPELSLAWNDMGECYWELGKQEDARNCFLGAVQHNALEAVGLRNLSIIYKQLPYSTAEEKNKNFEESLKFAKQAVDCNKSDGLSWMILGNVYLSQYFNDAPSDRTLLHKCITCYNLAETDIIAYNNPDLHLNRGTVEQYMENYTTAIKHYQIANCIEPNAQAAVKLTNTNKLITNSYITMQQLSSLKLIEKNQLLDRIDNCKAKPYPSYKEVLLSNLIITDNANNNSNTKSCISVAIVDIMLHPDSTPWISGCITRDSECVCVTVYGLTQVGGFSKGDVLLIHSPILICNTIVLTDGGVYTYNSIRVQNPYNLLVNGRKLEASRIAKTILAIQATT